ncbi:phenylalanine ammonia-lyase [Lindgomyces ingoldianus]|uniref:Phenylalanine ammonia-lyase n=1 Tax=Lindgomyces ingoldianus TaxID=673940 RepID=A0ACB6QHU7_9PLEO|nr:phenylalanine ammonia-lyase [Lindgomyces ingoldianus]KAF2466548.1 phenylalanine ammonia-lyase [Lindgomyces ingoldianus]
MPGKETKPNRLPHSSLVCAGWRRLLDHRLLPAPLVVDGEALGLVDVTAVARYGIEGALTSDETVLKRIEKSVDLLDEQLNQGETVYGVNTGYGGSADVRCSAYDMRTLQRALLQHLHCGVLPAPVGSGEPFSMSLKEEWVRAAILIRANSLARGHSAVRPQIVRSLLALLKHNITPLIPLRGSISASGDLSPLSYIAGALEGNPGIYCWVGPPHSRYLVPATEALASINLLPTVFGPKEGLGLVNGTAVSCAVATLTLHSIHNLLSLSQLLAAMNVEAKLGTSTSFAPFISAIRPHPGQAEVASTILSALAGSKLAEPLFEQHPTSTHGLFQDRYSLRTVPQWLGPFIEDLLLAHQQLSIELNSTTDNPLLDPEPGNIYHGGNFQAVSVTSAMEKSRLAAQAIGRMLFAQFTELLNPATNRGLPPSLCADDPSTSFTMKGLDVAMASYMSELSFLGNPVHNHVVSAEMGNQALNSLALISARYTDTAVDILSLMCATSLYAICQALDLRAMAKIFQDKLVAELRPAVISPVFKTLDAKSCYRVTRIVCLYIANEMPKTTTMDTKPRFEKIMDGVYGELVGDFAALKKDEGTDVDLQTLVEFSTNAAAFATTLFNSVREEYFVNGDATPLLGRASKQLYTFVRKDLRVPMHRGVADHPVSAPSVPGIPIVNGEGGGDEWRKKTVGHWVSVIHEAIKGGKIMDVVVGILEEGARTQEGLAGA